MKSTLNDLHFRSSRIIGLRRTLDNLGAQFIVEGSPSTIDWIRREDVLSIWLSIVAEVKVSFPKVCEKDHLPITAQIQSELRRHFPDEYIEVYVVNPG